MEAIRTKTAVDEWVFSAEYAVPLLRNHFKVHSLDGMGLGGHEAAAVAAGALLHYIQKTKQGAVEHVDGVRYYERSNCLELDAVSVRNLELVEPLFSGESAQTTLFYTLDACCTPMGKRLLRATLLRPANGLAEIEARLEAVAEAVADLRGREGVRRSMDGVLDLERLLKTLKPRQRRILEMAYLEDMPDLEIAEALGTTVVAVKCALYRVKRILRNAY